MPSRPIDVGWEIAADNRFQRIELRGTSTAVPDSAHSLHVELTGLRTPCSLIDRFQKGLKRAMIRKNARPRFRCGVLGVVMTTGRIALGDSVTVDLPPTGLQPLSEL